MSATRSATATRARSGGFHYAYAIALLSGIAVFAGFGLGRFAYGPLVPYMSEALALSNTEAGWLAFANMAVYTIGAPVAGILSARYGPRRVIVLALLLLAAGFFGLTQASSFWVAFALFGVVGTGSALTIIPALGILSAWFAPRRRGLGSGIALAGPPACFILIGILVPIVVGRDPLTAWRDIWAIAGALTVVSAVIVLVALRNRPADLGLDPLGGPIVRPPGMEGGLRAVVRLKSLWLLSAVYTFFGFAYVIYMTFMPSYIQIERGFDKAVVGNLWTALGIAALFGPFVFGTLSDRIGRRYGLALLMFLLGISLYSLILLPIETGMWVSAILYGFVMVAIVGVASSACGDYAGPALAPAAIGFATIFLGLGQAIGPPIAGRLADDLGTFVPAIVASAIIALVGSLAALLLPKPVRLVAAGSPTQVAAVRRETERVAMAESTYPHPESTDQPVLAGYEATAGETPDWTTWARQLIADETALATDLDAWAARTQDTELAEILDIAAARARDRAYRLRRTAPVGPSVNGARPAPAPALWQEGLSDVDLLDRLLDRPSRLNAPPPLPADSPEIGLLTQLRESEAETVDLLREQRQRLDAQADRRRIRSVEGEPGTEVGNGIAYWKVLRPASNENPSLARVSQMPGTCLRLPPAPTARILIWQEGSGTCRPVDYPGVDLTAGQVAEIGPNAPVEILTTGDWPATYLVVSSAPLPLPGEATEATAGDQASTDHLVFTPAARQQSEGALS